MAKPFFDRQGNLLIGKHKGLHWSKIPDNYVNWACDNISNFGVQYNAVAYGPPPEKPADNGRKRRYYKLDYDKKFIP